MPIGNVSRDSAPKRDSNRPPWVKNKDANSPPAWMQKRLKPVEIKVAAPAVVEAEETPAVAKPLKPALRKQATIRDKTENGVSEPVEEKLVKPSTAKLADKSRANPEEKSKFTKSALKSIDKIPKLEDKLSIDKGNEKPNEKLPEKPTLKSVRTIDDKAKEKSVTIVDKRPGIRNDTAKPNITTNDRPVNKTVVNDKTLNKTSNNVNEKPTNKTNTIINNKTNDKSTVNSTGKDNQPDSKSAPKVTGKPKVEEKESPVKPKVEEKAVIVKPKVEEKSVTGKPKVEQKVVPVKPKLEEKIVPVKPKVEEKVCPVKPKVEEKVSPVKPKLEEKGVPLKPKVEEKGVPLKPKVEEKVEMATKPPTNKLPPRKPSLQKQLSKDDPVKKWRDPLHERVKENIDKTLANEIPKGHTLTKNESLRSLLKPAPPPMPPPLPPKMPPPPEFKKAPLDPTKLKKIESLRSRPRRRPDWTDMMKEVEEGKKLKHVVCNDRSSPIITRSTVVKNKDQFIFESEKPTSHNALLKEINKGVRLKKTKTNDRSKPNLEGLRKFRKQMTIEEQVQKSMSQANLAASPSGIIVSASGIIEAAVPTEEEEIDEMDDIDKVRDDLQSTKQLLAIELRNKEVQERENKRLQTRIQNLEAELARERAIIRQEQHKTVISVTDAYDERLVNNLKMEVEKTKENADDLEKQYLQAAEDRDTALTELEEVKRQNTELEKKLQQALSNQIEDLSLSEEPLSFYQKRQLEFEKQCRLLGIDVNSAEANSLKKSAANTNLAYAYTNADDEGIMPTNAGSRRSSHAIKQLSVTKDDSFEEEEESEPEEEESEEKKQKRMEKELRNMRNKIRHLKEKQDHMKRERMGFKMSLKNQQAALKDAKKKYKELKREVDKMAAMMKEVGSDDDEDDEEEEESEDEKKSESEGEETETETEQDTESETESESEAEDAPLPKKKENLSTRLKRHESRVNALKKGNALLMANVDMLQDDVLKQREESAALQKELDSLVDDLDC